MGIFDRFKKGQGPTDPAAATEETTLVPGVGRIPFPAYRGREPYIFVSYAHADSGIVFPEIKRFSEQGYHVWYDEGIAPGSEWTDEIADALSACALFVVMMTPNSAGSHNVQNEINFAIDEKKPFVAIHLAVTNLRGGLKLQIGAKQAILRYNMTDNEYIYKYTSAFERLGMVLKNSAASGREQPVPAVSAVSTGQKDDAAKTVRQYCAQSEIERIQNSPVTMNDFEWAGTAATAYHGIKKRFAMPDRTAYVMSYTFKNCDLLEQVTLPEGVARLGAYSFCNCPNLELVVIVNEAAAIDDPGAFSQCPKLKVQCRRDSVTHQNLKRTFAGSILFF